MWPAVMMYSKHIAYPPPPQLTQLPENVPTLELNLFQNNLMNMLRKVWGSSHDHREPNSICYLCQGVGVWFGLATKILEEYRQVYREGSAGTERVFQVLTFGISYVIIKDAF